MAFLSCVIESLKNDGSFDMSTSLSSETRSSILIPKILDRLNNVFPLHNKISLLPEAMSWRVVFGTPLNKESLYTDKCLLVIKSKNVMLKLYRLTDLFAILIYYFFHLFNKTGHSLEGLVLSLPFEIRRG